MEKHTFTIFVADYSPTFTERSVTKLEKTATKKKPHIVIEAYHEFSDADVLLCVRIVDWWSLEQIPSLYIPSETFQKHFDRLGYRLDFIP